MEGPAPSARLDSTSFLTVPNVIVMLVVLLKMSATRGLLNVSARKMLKTIYATDARLALTTLRRETRWDARSASALVQQTGVTVRTTVGLR
jgi:hypothetical protein